MNLKFELRKHPEVYDISNSNGEYFPGEIIYEQNTSESGEFVFLTENDDYTSEEIRAIADKLDELNAE